MTRVVIHNHFPARDDVNWSQLKTQLQGKVCNPQARADAISAVVNALLTKWTNNLYERDTVRELVRYLAFHCELTVEDAAKRVVVILKTRRATPDSLMCALDELANDHRL
jgi:hypothetical protein